MKKQIKIGLILMLLLGFAPMSAEAITQTQISSTVLLACTIDSESWSLGSGTIINPSGTILTNKHVVTGQKSEILKYCLVAISENIKLEPDFKYIAETIHWSTDEFSDVAILKIDNSSSQTFNYVDIWAGTSSDLNFNEKIEVIGYPSIGGSTITYTSGDFSGFGSLSNSTQNYFKTTAPLEHGNSGGGAYSSNGSFVGIPTMVVSGTLNSISYILKVDKIKSWLSGLLGINYEDELEKKVEIPQVYVDRVDYNENISPVDFNLIKLRAYPIDDNGNILWNNELDLNENNKYSKVFFVWEDAPEYFTSYSNYTKGILTRINYYTSAKKDSLRSDYNIFSGSISYSDLNKNNPNFLRYDIDGGYEDTPRFVTRSFTFEEEGTYYIGIGAIKSGVFFVGGSNQNIKSGPIFWEYKYSRGEGSKDGSIETEPDWLIELDKSQSFIDISDKNPLGLRSNWLIKNNKFAEVFWVDENYCLHWIINEAVAKKNFGITWNYEGTIKEFNSIPSGYNFCGQLE